MYTQKIASLAPSYKFHFLLQFHFLRCTTTYTNETPIQISSVFCQGSFHIFMTVETEKQRIWSAGSALCDETPTLKLLQHSRSISRGKTKYTNLWVKDVGVPNPGSFIWQFFMKADWTRGRNIFRLVDLRFGRVEGRLRKSGEIAFCRGFPIRNRVTARIISVTTHVQQVSVVFIVLEVNYMFPKCTTGGKVLLRKLVEAFFWIDLWCEIIISSWYCFILRSFLSFSLRIRLFKFSSRFDCNNYAVMRNNINFKLLMLVK